jgi:hypothetical protein
MQGQHSAAIRAVLRSAAFPELTGDHGGFAVLGVDGSAEISVVCADQDRANAGDLARYRTALRAAGYRVRDDPNDEQGLLVSWPAEPTTTVTPAQARYGTSQAGWDGKPVAVAEHVAEEARRRGLGECRARFRHRPGLPVTIATVLLVSAAPGVLASGLHGATAYLAIIEAVAAPVLLCYWLFTAWTRWRGGLYLFTGGFADVYGRRHIEVMATWDEVGSILDHRTVYRINLIPIAFDRSCTIVLRGRRDALKLDGTYLGLSRALACISAHRPTAHDIESPEA